MSFLLLAFVSFLSAFLLFLIQPVTGEILTPAAGGSSVAWITCLLFFQVVLFLGYGLAWFLTHRFPDKAGLIQGFLILSGGVFLWAFPPPLQPESYFFDSLPIQWGVLGYLTRHFFIPVLALATTSTITQHCAASVVGKNASRLYAWSNAGSFTALLSFPFFWEGLTTRLEQIQMVWVGMLVQGSLFLLVSFIVQRIRPDYSLTETGQGPSNTDAVAENFDWSWLAIPFITSALMCGVTGHLSNEVASVPFLWIAPLALFLLSFILAFSSSFSFLVRVLRRLLPLFLVLTFFFLALTGLELTHGTIIVPLVVHLFTFFILSFLLNDQLHSSRPSHYQLGRFYFFLALGGLAGTAFQALMAPILFSRLGYPEYPLALLLAMGLLGYAKNLFKLNYSQGIILTLILVLSVGSIFLLRILDPNSQSYLVAACVGTLLVLSYPLCDHMVWFSVASAMVLSGSWLGLMESNRVIITERNAYGMIRISQIPDGEWDKNLLIHGGTIHGIQSTGQMDEFGRFKPLSYYGERGPAGFIFRKLESLEYLNKKVGVIGLGVGSLSWYAHPQESWTFFELDPAVGWAATDSGYFSFVGQARSQPNIVFGDGRRRLSQSEGEFDLLILDAFSSDTIPVHLLTLEALDLYLSQLGPNGTLLCHISNRHFDLLPVINGWEVARGLKFHFCDDRDQHPESIRQGYSPSQWVTLTRNPDLLKAIKKSTRWNSLPEDTRPLLWTDDHHSVFSVLKW